MLFYYVETRTGTKTDPETLAVADSDNQVDRAAAAGTGAENQKRIGGESCS